MIGSRINIAGFRTEAWRPDPEVENRKANGEVITRKMTPEEYEKYFVKMEKQTTDSEGNPIRYPSVGWRTNEKYYREMRAKMAKEKGVAKKEEPENEKKPQRKRRKSKYAHITKEYILEQFSKGVTIQEIEKSQGMPKNTMHQIMRKYGLKSPYKRGGSFTKSENVDGLKKERDQLAKMVDSLKEDLAESVNRLDTEREENERLRHTVERLRKELDAAKGYADMAQVGKVSQEGNDIVIKISLPREVVGQ